MKSQVAPYQTLAWCVRIVCKNGTTIRITSYPVDLKMSNATVYVTDSGYDMTSYITDDNMSPSALDLEGIIGIGGVTREQVAAGVFDGARIYIFKCSSLSPVEDYEPVMSGIFGKTTITDNRYKIEGMSLIDVLNQSIGKVYSPLCVHTFGDSKCSINLAAITINSTLTGVISAYSVVDSARTEVSDYFGAGTIRFISGVNAGLPPIEIRSFIGGTIVTYEPFTYTPSIGDAYEMIPGCRKTREACRDKWNNTINALAFWDLPVSGVYMARGAK